MRARQHGGGVGELLVAMPGGGLGDDAEDGGNGDGHDETLFETFVLSIRFTK